MNTRLEDVSIENNELKEKIKSVGFQQAQASNGDEKNIVLTRQINSLQDKLSKAHQDNKSLLDKIRNIEENNATSVRSFKARKNELQMQLANTRHEKEDLEKEVGVLRERLTNEEARALKKEVVEKEVGVLQEKVANVQALIVAKENLEKEVGFLRESLANEQARVIGKENLETEVGFLRAKLANEQARAANDRKIAETNSNMREMQEKLKEDEEQTREAHRVAAELQLQNREYTRKLHESEVLILDLQRAVARSNDVAMEKALESSRSKRMLEKKFEKILKENSNIRKSMFFEGPTMSDREQNTRNRSRSDVILQNQESNGHQSAFGQVFPRRKMYEEHPLENEPNIMYRRKQSIDLIQSSQLDRSRDVTLARSGSAPLSKRLSTTNSINNQLVIATVMARSVSPPVRYFSDTDSLGSKPESNDDDTAPTSTAPPKPPPPSYYATNRCVPFLDADLADFLLIIFLVAEVVA